MYIESKYGILCITDLEISMKIISVDGDLGINKLVFLQTRAYKKDAASLIASGPRGHIHFWNVFQGGKLMAQFPVVSMCGIRSREYIEHFSFSAHMTMKFVLVINVKMATIVAILTCIT